jgi:hypothetical protein
MVSARVRAVNMPSSSRPLDLVVVSRVDRDLRLPEPRFTEVAEFLRLVAKAGGHDDRSP